MSLKIFTRGDQMKRILIIILSLFLTISIPAQEGKSAKQSVAEYTSLINVISNPEKYDGKRVRVSGFLHFQFEDSVLYFSKDDADHLISENGIWVRYANKPELEAFPCIKQKDEINLSYFDGLYVSLEGTFVVKNHGHLGLSSGAIEEVTRVSEHRKWFDGQKKVIVINKEGQLERQDCK